MTLYVDHKQSDSSKMNRSFVIECEIMIPISSACLYDHGFKTLSIAIMFQFGFNAQKPLFEVEAKSQN